MKVYSFFALMLALLSFSLETAAREFSGSSQRGNETSLTSSNTPGPNDEVREGYEEKCLASDKTKRIQKYNACKTRFTELGLPGAIDEGDIIQKFSCPNIESYKSEMAIGCAQYSISLPIDAVKGLGSILGIGKYNADVLKACGEEPTRRQSYNARSTGPERLEHYQNAMSVYGGCKTQTVESVKARQARESTNYSESMSATRRYCSEKSQLLASYIRRVSQLRKGGRQDLMVRSCRLEALAKLNLDCSRCIEELSPETGNIENSSMFKSMVDNLNQYRALQCYNPKKVGELVCAGLAAAAGGAGSAVALSKLVRALGQESAEQMVNAGKRMVDEAEPNTPSSVVANSEGVLSGAVTSRERAQRILNNVDGERAETARRAATTRDSLETRKTYAEAVLNIEEGSLSDIKAQAVWDAHKVTDGNNQTKAIILRRAGFDDTEVRALMNEKYKVAGGYQEVGPLLERVQGLTPPRSPDQALGNARAIRELILSDEFPSLGNKEELLRQAEGLYEGARRNLSAAGNKEEALQALEELKTIVGEAKHERLDRMILNIQTELNAANNPSASELVTSYRRAPLRINSKPISRVVAVKRQEQDRIISLLNPSSPQRRAIANIRQAEDDLLKLLKSNLPRVRDHAQSIKNQQDYLNSLTRSLPQKFRRIFR